MDSLEEKETLDQLVDLSINYLTYKSYEHLSPNEMRVIIKMLSQLDYFKNLEDHLGNKGIRQIAKCIGIKQFNAGSEVIKYGDEGKTFYIILKGEVNILIPNFHKKGEMEFVKIGKLGRGASFGDLALIRKKPRSATITCLTDSVMAELNYEDYQSLLNQIESEKLNNFINFLRSFEIFTHIPRSYIERFYFICEAKKLSKNQIVYKEGDEIDGIYFITKGEFSVTKIANYSKNEMKEVESELDYLKKEQNVLLHSLYGHYNLNSSYMKNLEKSISPKTKKFPDRIINLKPPKTFQLIILKDHDVFGDLEIFKENPKRIATVTCKANSQTYFFQKEKFLKTLTPFLKEGLKQMVDLKCEILNSRMKNGTDFYMETPRNEGSERKTRFNSKTTIKSKSNVKMPHIETTPVKILQTEESKRKVQITENITFRNSKLNILGNSQEIGANSKQKIIKKSYIIEDNLNKFFNFKAKMNVTTYVTEQSRTKNETVNMDKLKELNKSLKKFHHDKVTNKLHGLLQKTLNGMKITNKLEMFRKNGALLKAVAGNKNITESSNMNNTTTVYNVTNPLQETTYSRFIKNPIKKKRFFAPLILDASNSPLLK